MADEKLTNPKLIKLRCNLALRELALAAFYPQTHTGIVAHRKRDNPDPPENVAKPWKKPWEK